MGSHAALFRAAPAQSNDFPNVTSSYLKQPKKVVYDDLVKVTMGSDKNTIRSALGDPHFHEFGSSTWNYWLAVHDNATNTFKECQLRLDFQGGNKTVSGIKWKDDACQALATSRPITTVEKVIVNNTKAVQPYQPVVARQPVKYSIKTDGLFAFNSAKLITQNANYQKLDSLIGLINNNAAHIFKVTIVGNADRLGSNEYNQSLGFQRANAIRNLITIPNDKIVVQSNGENNPVTSCSSGLSRKQLIDCLADDRRADIEVTALQ